MPGFSRVCRRRCELFRRVAILVPGFLRRRLCEEFARAFPRFLRFVAAIELPPFFLPGLPAGLITKPKMSPGLRFRFRAAGRRRPGLPMIFCLTMVCAILHAPLPRRRERPADSHQRERRNARSVEPDGYRVCRPGGHNRLPRVERGRKRFERDGWEKRRQFRCAQAQIVGYHHARCGVVARNLRRDFVERNRARGRWIRRRRFRAAFFGALRIKTSTLPLLRRIFTAEAFIQPVPLVSFFSLGAGLRENAFRSFLAWAARRLSVCWRFFSAAARRLSSAAQRRSPAFLSRSS